MPLLKNVSVVSACLLATVSMSNAEPIQLSSGQLDHVTAGAISPIPPITPIAPIAPIAPITPIGGVGGAPPVGSLPDPAPSPPPPPQLTLESGEGAITVFLPTSPEGSTTEIDARITPRAGGTSGTAYVRVLSGGGGPIDLPGVSGSVVHSGD